MTCLALSILSLWFLTLPATAEIVVYDSIAVTGRETAIAAETRGTFFSRGGELVEFFIGERSLGKVLSGGDGFAYRYFTPRTAGLVRVTVRSAREEGTGSLLLLKRGQAVVAVDVESGLMEKAPTGRPREESQDALNHLSARYPVVLVHSGALPLKAVRKWLQENKFPELPLLPWRQGALLDELDEMGVKLRAVVGGAAVVDASRRHKARVFSFDKLEGAREVNDWEEIRKQLK